MGIKGDRGIIGLLVMGLFCFGCDGGSNEFVPTSLEEGGSSATGETIEGTSAEGEVTEQNTEGGQQANSSEQGENVGGFPAIGEFPNGCSATEDNCDPSSTCVSAGEIGACAATPQSNTTLSDPYSQEVDDTVAPDFSCVNQYPPAEASTQATIYGVVDRFGKGYVTDNILIRVFRSEDFNPWACDALEPEEKAACLTELVENHTPRD